MPNIRALFNSKNLPRLFQVILAFFAANLLFAFAPSIAQAATITVDALSDNNSGGNCELRDAINAANGDTPVDTCVTGSGSDTIVFGVSGTITLTSDLPTVIQALNIDGGGNLILDGDNLYRILNVNVGASTFALQNIDLINGAASSGACIFMFNGPVVTITNVLFDNCNATNDGGAIYGLDGGGGATTFNLTDVTMTNNSTVSGTEGGAGIYVGNANSLNAVNFTAIGNETGNGDGSAIFADSYSGAPLISITGNSLFQNNITHVNGAVFISRNTGHIIDGATFENNFCGDNFTSCFGSAITLGSGGATVTSSTFVDNQTESSGGTGYGGAIGVFLGSMLIEDSYFDGNSAYYAGAIYVSNGATLDIERSTFAYNAAGLGGGGAIFVDSGGGAVTVNASAFIANSTTSIITGGGAIRIDNGSLDVTNSTFDSNTADYGGALLTIGGINTIINNTFSNNIANVAGGALYLDNPTTTWANNILEGNTAPIGPNCTEDTPADSDSSGNNLIVDATDCPTIGSDIIGSSALLGVLALNSGTTLSRAPGGGSPAINAASAVYAPAFDQRGVSRPIGLADDIGSIEISDVTAPTIGEVTPVPTPTNDTTPNYTFSSDEAGTINYSGDCSSATTVAAVGNNTITFNALATGLHDNCIITVTDNSLNVSNVLNISAFFIEVDPPILTEVTPVPSPTSDSTPDYTFSSDEAGTINYSGDCSSGTTTAVIGGNTITFNALGEGLHGNCTITVTDNANNTSLDLDVSAFVVDTIAPTLTEVTPVVDPTNDTTPDYTFSSTESGNISYGGDCSSATTTAVAANNTITFNTLVAGAHTNCTVTVTDGAGNVSNLLDVSDFTIDLAVPNIAEVTPVPPQTNDTTPDYTFSSDKSGTINYGGDCSSSTTAAVIGNNTVTFNVLGAGAHTNCTITVTDVAMNISNILAVSNFTIDLTSPVIAEVTPVTTPTTDQTPDYTFSSDEAGAITYGGDCSSSTTAAAIGNNTITFNALTDGIHNNCTILVTDAAGNFSNLLNVSSFEVDADSPIIAEVTPVVTPTTDTTPDYTFSSTEIGNITYGGSCSSATTIAAVGNNTITFNALADGYYSNCTIMVTDAALNVSNTLNVTTFLVDTTPPIIAEVIPVPTPTTDSTPDYTFSSTETASIAYGGSCSSATNFVTPGNNTITFNTLANGTYSNCTITVTDAGNFLSNILNITTFTVNASTPPAGDGGGSGGGFGAPASSGGNTGGTSNNPGSNCTNTSCISDLPQPEAPGQSTPPTQPEQPTPPAQPTQPQQPTPPEQPAQPENPVQPTPPETPSQPQPATQPEQPTQPTNPILPDSNTLPIVEEIPTPTIEIPSFLTIINPLLINEGSGIYGQQTLSKTERQLSFTCNYSEFSGQYGLTISQNSDFDGDGLSDQLECLAQTNPALADTDGDGFSDSYEELTLGTNPNQSDVTIDPATGRPVTSTLAITTPENNMLTGDATPLFKGVNTSGNNVQIYILDRRDFEEISQQIIAELDSTENLNDAQKAEIYQERFSQYIQSILQKFIDNDLDSENPQEAKFLGRIQLLGEAPTGANGIFLFTSDKSLMDNSYLAIAHVGSLFSQEIQFKVDSQLKVLNPDVATLGNQPIPAAALLGDLRVEIESGNLRPVLVGNIKEPSKIVANWQSDVISSALIADSLDDEFRLAAPSILEPGDHTVYITAYRRSDGAQSETLKIPFHLSTEGAVTISTENNNMLYLLGGVVTLLIISGAILIIRKKRSKVSNNNKSNSNQI